MEHIGTQPGGEPRALLSETAAFDLVALETDVHDELSSRLQEVLGFSTHFHVRSCQAAAYTSHFAAPQPGVLYLHWDFEDCEF